MRVKNKIMMKLMASACIVSMVSCTLAADSFAGPPAIDTDEALYVNLDYYGKQTDSSVVKGCNLNGIRTFTDYGSYTDVTNMTNHAEPVVTEEGVTWELPADAKERFYYECQLNNGEVVLPWDFDVSYKLNGIPMEAEKLAGANGLVEIDVKCMPSDQAKEYYKNNMLLQVAAMVNMEDVNSVLAPGSQLQSLGTYKVIIFAAVPGEESDFHIEISTTDFDFMGLIMMMFPGTLDQMKEIKDIKEMKDTVADSTEELLDGMNEILDKLDNISQGMDIAKAGLEDLQKARAGLDAAKDSISASADASLDSLEGMNSKIGELAPDLNAGKQTFDQINTDVNHMVEALRKSGDHFFELAGRLSDLEDDLGDLKKKLDSADTDGLSDLLMKIEGALKDLENALQSLEDNMVDLADLTDPENGSLTPEELEEELQNFKDNAYEILDQLGSVVGDDAVDSLRDQLDAVDVQNVGGDYGQVKDLMKKLQTVVKNARTVTASIRHSLRQGNVDDLLRNSQEAAGELASIMGAMETLIGDVSDLNRTVNENKPSFDLLMDDTISVVTQLNDGTNNLIQMLRTVQQTARANRSAVENGTRQTLDGLIDVLEKASNTTGTGERMQKANNDLKDSIKGELDKVDNETNLLELDTEQQMISFTSDKNPAPSSIQIVLRTQEISEEDINTNVIDIEPQKAPVTIWERIANVFQKIWNAVTSIFS